MSITNYEIAKMLKTYNEWRRGEGQFSEIGCKPPYEPKQLGALIELAAHRLENAQLLTETMFDAVTGDDHASDRALGRIKDEGGKEKTQKRSRRK